MILIGTGHTKRTDYFMKAAQACDAAVQLIEWERVFADFEGVARQLKGASVKIDPPSYSCIELPEMKRQLIQYKACLNKLGTVKASYLNEPQAILTVLDKRKTKQILQEKHICTTELLADRVSDVTELLELMKEKGAYSVFIKPCEFSGAAGVAAFRVHPATGRMKLYTSCKKTEKGLCNTKKLRCIDDYKEIMELLTLLIKLDVIAERWHAKDTMGTKAYDMRVVFQFGRVVHIVVRCANGPITNLHLNNQAAELSQLGLASGKLDEIEQLCACACSEIAGLRAAGIDVMLDKGSKKPRIIEINGQGDLIYQDIFDRNEIYRQQCRYMEEENERRIKPVN